MKGTHLPSDCKHKRMLEFHLTNLASCTVCYIDHSMVLTAGSMFQGYHTLVLSINSIFLQTVWVPLIVT